MKNTRTLASCSLLFALAACGGGGGGAPAPAPAPAEAPAPAPAPAPTISDTITPPTGTYAGTVDFDAGYTEALTSTPSRHIAFIGQRESENNGTVSYSHDFNYAAGSTDLLGTSYRSVLLQTTLASRAGYEYVRGDLFYELAPVRMRGMKWADGTVTLATPTGALPTAGRVGDSGAFYTYTTYTDSTRATVESRGTTTWSIEADTTTTVFLCLNTSEIDSEGTSTLQACAQAVPTAAGHFSGRGRFVMTDPQGNRIVFNRAS
jgi:hypothetical protein